MLVIVRVAHPFTFGWLVALFRRAGHAFPLAPIILRITLPFFRVAVRCHFVSPSSSTTNGCLAFALTMIPDFILISNTRSGPLLIQLRTVDTETLPSSYVATRSPRR